VVQLYVAFPREAAEPPRQLKGFERVSLKPGESRTVTMKLDNAALRAWDEVNHDWKVYPGRYEVEAGSSSRDIRYRDSFTVTN
jgi:beta-glucosidase